MEVNKSMSQSHDLMESNVNLGKRLLSLYPTPQKEVPLTGLILITECMNWERSHAPSFMLISFPALMGELL